MIATFQSPGATLELGFITLRWYGLLIAAAVFIGIWLSQRLARQRQINPDLIADLSIWLVVAAIPAARLYYVAFNWEFYQKHLDQVVQIWRGGIAIHGAILGGMLAMAIFTYVQRLSFWQVADVIAPSLILGQAIGRWGNFFNSEAFGAPTDLPWKLYIPVPQRPPELINEAYYHPTFLYESLWNLGVFALLLWLFHQPRYQKPGTLLLVYAIAYSLGRFWIEGLRMDSLMLGPLRIAQVVSLVAIALGAWGLFRLYYQGKPLPDWQTA
ncbi:prolipoprotein diacylglyceryl transferase [Thermosynechococcus sp. HN-54]|uniref:prolipoprotein diacylglyceryl transferase n=1 Tax=Thermosynechococcus sp. HN-54 TaxID=2933959 RepID=UPI00202CCF07|nr:prolipoprotein diacylglyceryl transferase [Thermosynechococcus sp. HN-54]URR34577.1 prolipoprotein diacylglyceryl transferase [Thermosynechococcus sp. HN-54]